MVGVDMALYLRNRLLLVRESVAQARDARRPRGQP
jgi:hypothetical protein